MSIRIDKEMCMGCGKCLTVCPGGLIYGDEEKKAFIKYPQECWGCTACLKECHFGAINYFLGADIGGKGTYLYTKDMGKILHWFVVKDGTEHEIIISKEEANRY